jgi:hypothetical protein
MGVGAVRVAVLVFLAVASSTAHAEYWRPAMHPLDGSGFASEDQVSSSVGALSIDVNCPSRRFADAMQRGARVTVEKAGFHDPGVLSTLLHDALVQIWDQCDTAMGSFGNSVGYVEVYAPTGSNSTPALVMRAEKFMDISGTWQSIRDIAAEQQEAADDAAAQQQAAQQQAAAQAQAQQQAQEEAARQQQLAAQQAEAQAAADQQAQIDAARRQENVEQIKDFFLRWLPWAFVALVMTFLFRQRERFARWYYFYFHPHPAAPLVKAVVSDHTSVDGTALVAVLNEAPSGSRAFRAVRLIQTERLFRQLEKASAARLKRQRKEAKSNAARDYEHAAWVSIQESVKAAALVLERAKALHKASQDVRRSP